MTALIGNDGNATLAGHVSLLNRWTARFARTISDVTPFGNSVLTDHVAGLWGISGSASGALDAALAPAANSVDADGVAIVLTVGASNTYSFTGIVSGIAADVNKIGDALITFDFVGGDVDDFAESWA